MIHSINSIFAEIDNLSEADLMVLSYIKICYVCKHPNDLSDDNYTLENQIKYKKFLNKDDIKDAFSKKIIKEALLKYHNISYFFDFDVVSDFHQETIISARIYPFDKGRYLIILDRIYPFGKGIPHYKYIHAHSKKSQTIPNSGSNHSIIQICRCLQIHLEPFSYSCTKYI